MHLFIPYDWMNYAPGVPLGTYGHRVPHQPPIFQWVWLWTQLHRQKIAPDHFDLQKKWNDKYRRNFTNHPILSPSLCLLPFDNKENSIYFCMILALLRPSFSLRRTLYSFTLRAHSNNTILSLAESDEQTNKREWKTHAKTNKNYWMTRKVKQEK